MRILGIDPGYAIVGYGVIQAAGGSYRPVEYGAITTPAGADFGQRLLEIYQGMEELLRRLCPEAAAVEKLYFSNNKTTGIGVADGQSQGVGGVVWLGNLGQVEQPPGHLLHLGL